MTRASLPTGAVTSTPFPDGCGLRQTLVAGDGEAATEVQGECELRLAGHRAGVTRGKVGGLARRPG